MANASGLAADQVELGAYTQTRSGTTYRISTVDRQPFLSTHNASGTQTSQHPLHYFLGSGHLGTTWLYDIGPYLFESPLAWYRPSHSFDMKPGLEDMTQAPPPLPMQSSCMRCHMSDVQPSDPGTLNRFTSLPFLHGGITCEQCHGNADRHVASKGREAVLNPATLRPELRDSICISCHMEGDISVEKAGRSALNYRPGERIADYLAFYVRTDARITARGVSEVEQFAQSTCKRVSGDRMSCSSCHDPHQTPDPAHRAAFYRARCLTCHSQPGFAAKHHPENADCTACHMPSATAANILHVAWTDHRILRVPDSSAPARTDGPLTPIFSPHANDRDRAMANYLALLEGDRSLEPTAWQQLSALRGQLDSDKEALDAYGNLAAERRQFPAAEQAFRRALQLDPVDLTALSNLGVLTARQGKIREAAALLHTAFDRNQDVPGLARNLARIECMAGDSAAARATLDQVLAFGELDDVRAILPQVQQCNTTP